MSACISRHGEYSSHVHEATGDHRFVCTRCWVLDEDAILTALDTAETRADRAEAQGRAVEAAIIAPYPPSPFADNIINRVRAALAQERPELRTLDDGTDAGGYIVPPFGAVADAVSAEIRRQAGTE